MNMIDIVERLRDAGCESGFAVVLKFQYVEEAAAEIERLRKIEAAYNSIIHAEADLRRAKDGMTCSDPRA